MLDAISKSTLSDDVFREDDTTNSLQEYIARRTGHENALLVMSGTMGNQVAIRSHLTEPPYSILCDDRAHILRSEAGGVSAWTGATVYGIKPRNGMYITLEEIQEHAILGDNIHRCPTKLISLENTIHGLVMPLRETRRIIEWAHAHGIKAHLDGARLWDAVVTGAGTLPEYTSIFDSVSLCFSKGLGAPIGSILVGSSCFINKARWFRKSIGGGIRQAGIISAAARIGMEEVFGPRPDGGGKLRGAHIRARKAADMWTSRGGKLLYPVHTNMLWVDIKAAGLLPSDLANIGKQKGLRLAETRIVMHYRETSYSPKRSASLYAC